VKHVAVNFHYVGMPALPHPGIHGYDVQGFRECLTGIGRRCDFVSLPDVLQAVESGGELPESSCLVTFDDGMRCQYEHALPVLEALGIAAAFFVSGDPLANGRAAAVHKLHWSRANLGDAAVMAFIEKLAQRAEGLPHPREVDMAAAADSYRYDEPETARLKFYLNYQMPDAFVEELLRDLFEHMQLVEADFAADFYMSRDMVRDLAARDMLGSHAITHRPLAKMSVQRARAELAESGRLLEAIGGRPIRAVSYPLGNRDAVSPAVAEQAEAAGYSAGYTMERACNVDLRQPLLLGRVDARDADGIADLPARSRYTCTDGDHEAEEGD
jgi:peptidoglycan/xylan/chitin deacetylase (PgdA/CDA1 family)